MKPTCPGFSATAARRALFVALAAALAVIAPSARATSYPPAPIPPFPRSWLTRDVCPFECCTYRRWCARRAIPVHASESRTAPVAFTIARGDSFDALGGNVHVTRTGEARVLRMFQIPTQSDRILAFVGDRIALLEYRGEDATHAWLRGRECWIDVDWLSHPGPTTAEGEYDVYDQAPGKSGGRSKPPYIRVLRWPTTWWWVHVRALDGREGWILADDGHEDYPFDNADACG